MTWRRFVSEFGGAEWLSALALAVTLLVAPVASAQTNLPQLEEMWKSGDYVNVLPKLIDYRERTRTRNANIDYMIATSACRIPNQRQAGNAFFDWILYNYNLNSDNRTMVEREKQRCNTQAAPAQFRPMTPAALVGITYHGKEGTRIRASSSGNGASEVVEPIANDVLARRLFAIQSADAARNAVVSTLGSGSEVEHVGHFLLVNPPADERSTAPHVEQGPSPGILNAAQGTTGASTLNGPDIPIEVPGFKPKVAATPNRAAPPNAAASPNPGVDPAKVNPAGVNPANVSPANVNTPGVSEEISAAASHRAVQSPMPMEQRAIHMSTDASDLRHVGEDLEKYLRFFASEYGMLPPSHLITVYFARNVSDLQSLARKLHGIQLAPGSIGYSFPADQSMAGWADGSSYGTFAHELFHVMVRNNFGDIPPWLDEGMASLYEVSRLEDGRAVGVDNWRREILRDHWATRPSLAKLVQMNRSAFDEVEGRSDRFLAGENQAVNHATARYFMLYLQQRGKLKAVYKAFINRKVNDEPAKQAVDLVERTLGRSLDDVDADFARWFQSLS